MASRLAQELECELGTNVGYKVRFSDQVSDTTQVKLMTDGILLAELQNDKFAALFNTTLSLSMKPMNAV